MISLPKDPTGAQYEDMVVAALLAAGYFVEPQLTLRDGGKEVLELDVVATPVGGSLADRVLYEVKRERFRFSNIFKVFGQRTYLGIPAAKLVSLEGAEDSYRAVYQSRGAELGVEVCHLPPDLAEIRRLGTTPNGLAEDRHRMSTAIAWYGQIARRMALGELQTLCGQNRGVPEFEAPRAYRFNVRASFFQRDALARAEALYSAYLATPRMSGGLVRYEAGRQGTTEDQVWKRVRNQHRELAIQGLMDLEAYGRLSIVKNALDDVLERGGNPPPTTALKVGSLSLRVPVHALPQSFHGGLEALAAHPHGRRLPYLFQCFYALFGGFLVLDDDQDRQLLAAFTGVPANELEGALRLFDAFFGGDERSLFFTPQDSLFCMKMVPGFVRGTGAFLRQTIGDLKSYEDRYPKMGWLIAHWHNALYHVLQPQLGTKGG